MPSPRNDSPLSSRIALPTPSVVATIAGPSALGSACRHSTRRDDAPSAVAASTIRSVCARRAPRRERVARRPSSRSRRAPTTTVDNPGRHSAAHTSNNTRRGSASSASAIDISTASMTSATPRRDRTDAWSRRRSRASSRDADGERDASGEHHAHEQVASESIGAEQMEVARARRALPGGNSRSASTSPMPSGSWCDSSGTRHGDREQRARAAPRPRIAGRSGDHGQLTQRLRGSTSGSARSPARFAINTSVA